jgi:predicted O-linked N-acetylglucosamine transferase (SPINDLY family)
VSKPAPGVDPRQLQAAFQQAVGLHQAGRLPEAAGLYDRILAAAPDHPDALHLRGLVALQTGQGKQGVRMIAKAIQLAPRVPAAHSNLGKGYRDLGQPKEGLAACDRAIALAPDYAEAHYNRAGCLQDLGRLAESLAAYDRVLALAPGMPAAQSDRSNVLLALGRPAEALEAAEAALARMPNLAEAQGNRGSALRELRRLPEALACYDQALALRPDHPALHLNRGNLLREMGRLEEAVAAYDRALALAPALAEAFANRAAAWLDLRRFDKAIADHDQALALRPDAEFLAGTALFARMQACDWAGCEARVKALVAGIRQGRKVARPFAAVALTASRGAQLQAARIWAGRAAAVEPPRPAPGPRIRLGYFSADFQDHATAYLAAEVFERHDRDRFEVVAYSWGPPSAGAMRRRLEAAFDRFVDVAAMSDEAVAALARAEGIDIAIDLKGYTQDARPGILARRAAPVQVGWLGYPGSMGTDHINYMIADPVTLPEDHRADYAERIAWLPHSYQPNDSRRAIAATAPDRVALGLPAEGVVFCCFNNSWKITPEAFGAWMDLLRQVPGSVLWLLEDNPVAPGNLRREAASRGIDPARLLFAPKLALAEHLARHAAADLFLDTLPYGAHTTASDALWAGLPVLTQLGQTFAGRVAASLLTAIGLPELITTSREEYAALALALARDPARLAALRAKLAANRATHPLFDAALFTRHLEAAFEAMQARHLAGLPPENLRIPA